MDVREKLVELLEERRMQASEVLGSMNKGFGAWYADHLIAHGVTVQQPQKPIEHKVDVTAIVVGNAHWCKGTTLYKCPKCGSFISRIYDYCFKCGQAFDWSGWGKSPKGE